MIEQGKREWVIEGLEFTLEESGWDANAAYDQELMIQVVTEAIALLKAQEPRVMALEELLDLKYDDVVYLEDFPTKSVFSAIVIEVVPKLPDVDIGVVQFRFAPTWNGINNADLSYYGKVWRCWTSRPTDAQREATPWES